MVIALAGREFQDTSRNVLKAWGGMVSGGLQHYAECCREGRSAAGYVIRSMRCPRRTAELRFRAATGMSVLEAIDEVRFERALGLLRKKSLPIAEIAAACAFSSETMFRRFFRKRAGVSPREWRNGARG